MNQSTAVLGADRQAVLAATDSFVVVEGAAGSGKTTLAVGVAVERRRRLGKGAILLGFLNSTRLRLREKLREEGELAEGHEVSTVDALIVDIVTRHRGLLELTADALLGVAVEKPEEDFARLRAAAITLMERFPSIPRTYSRRYGVVILDEFQDLDERQYLFVRLLARDLQLFCFGDRSQALRELFVCGVSWSPIERAIQDGAIHHTIPILAGAERFERPSLRALEQALRSEPQGIVVKSSEVKVYKYYKAGAPEVLAKTIKEYELFGRGTDTSVLICETRETLNNLYRSLRQPPMPVWVRRKASTTRLASAFRALQYLGGAIIAREAKTGSVVLRSMSLFMRSQIAKGKPFEKHCAEMGPRRLAPHFGSPLGGVAMFGARVCTLFGELADDICTSYPNLSHANLEEARDTVARVARNVERVRWTFPISAVGWDRTLARSHRRARRELPEGDSCPPGGVVLLTVDQAKNREFDRAIFVVDPRAYLKDVTISALRAHIYVACTRARRRLAIFRYNQNASPTWNALCVTLAQYAN